MWHDFISCCYNIGNFMINYVLVYYLIDIQTLVSKYK